MIVSILGTAPPLLTMRAGNAGTGLLVSEGGVHVMLDCGPGVVHRLSALGVDVRSIEALVLTHHHWDHIGDLGHFVLGRWEASQFGAAGGKPFAKPLTIYGPTGTAEIIEKLFGREGVYAGDIATRLAPDIGIPLYGTRDIRMPFPAVAPNVKVVSAGDEWLLGPIKFKAERASHCQPYLESMAYRMEVQDISIVFTGDTAPCEGVRALAQGANLLLHDCNIAEAVRAGLGHVSTHSTAAEVGRLAEECGVKHVVAVHHGQPVANAEGRQKLFEAISEGFGGQVTIATELDRFDLDAAIAKCG